MREYCIYIKLCSRGSVHLKMNTPSSSKLTFEPDLSTMRSLKVKQNGCWTDLRLG